MKNLIDYLSKKSLSPEDASGMAREWSGIASALPRKLFALLFCLLFVGGYIT